MARRRQTIRIENRPVALTEDRGKVLSSCLVLDVHSQGESAGAARVNLTEAVQLFLDSCAALGTRAQVLAAAGFGPEAQGIVPPPECRSECCPCHPGEA